MSVIAAMAAVAVEQHGLAHLAQLRAAGVTKAALEHAVRVGELERPLPEVYAIAGVPWTWRRRLLAAVLDAGPDAVASHRAAAKLLGLAHRDAPELLELTLPLPRFSRAADVVVHRSTDLQPDHVVRVDGIPCTGPLRTLVDLGAVEPWFVVADALERGLQSGQVTLLGAEWMLTKLSRRGRNGCGVFRQVLDTRALQVASPHPGLLEPRMARVLAGIAGIEYQHKVFDASGSFVAQVDFAVPACSEAFEVDGFEAHGTPAAMTADFARDHRLRAAGWNVTHFTWFQVVKEPAQVRSTVLTVLRAHGLA